MTREQNEAKMRATIEGDQVRYIGRSMFGLETGMIGVILSQNIYDGHRVVSFGDGQQAIIRPYGLSSWEAL